jgi:hypothetical protein
MARVGRKSKLTDQAQGKIVEHLENGGTAADACVLAGVSISTFYEWLQRGRNGDVGFSHFAGAVEQAREVPLAEKAAARLAELERLASLKQQRQSNSTPPVCYTELHLCNLVKANVQQIASALGLSPVAESSREYRMPSLRPDFVFRHIDGTHTLVEVKTRNSESRSLVRKMHQALGQGVFYTAAYSAIEQVDVSKVRLCLLVDFDIDEDAFLENTLTTALERIDMPITVVNVIRLLGLTDGAQQPLL